MKKQDETKVLQAWQEVVQAEVKTRPWLAALFLQKGNQLFARFVDFYGRLTAVKQQTRRRLAVGVGTAALMLALSSAPTPAHAANITVTPGAAGIANNGQCSLVEAIINANNDALTHADCAAGSGADTIVLAGNTYSYTTANGTGSALPNITSPITIEANGATIQRTSGNMRLILVNAGGNLTLNNATITGGAGVSAGGGIYNNLGGMLTLNNSTVSGNTATFGGGISTNNGTTILNNSTVSGNTATNDGGGIENFNISNTTLNNSTVSGNAATNGGGGIFVYNSNTTLNNSTVTGNTATTRGGGIDNFSGTTTLNRSIVSGNTSPTGAEVRRNSGTFNAANHNVFGHNLLTNAQAFTSFTPGATDINATSDGGGTPTALASILNTTLANNGGPTLTHALVSGSPAIDIAPAANCAGAPINGLDQRGVSRSIDGDLDSTAACDAGAVEQEVPEVCGVAIATDYTLAGATLNIANLGTDLHCFQVALINENHPNATSSGSNNALETGRFWRIHALRSDVSTPATTDYNVSLTLPFAGANNNSRVCKWLDGVGPGFGWDCDNSTTSNMANTSVTRTGISSFSDWAVGDAVGPTAVSNRHTQTNTPATHTLPALLATLLTLLTSVTLWARRHVS